MITWWTPECIIYKIQWGTLFCMMMLFTLVLQVYFHVKTRSMKYFYWSKALTAGHSIPTLICVLVPPLLICRHEDPEHESTLCVAVQPQASALNESVWWRLWKWSTDASVCSSAVKLDRETAWPRNCPMSSSHRPLAVSLCVGWSVTSVGCAAGHWGFEFCCFCCWRWKLVWSEAVCRSMDDILCFRGVLILPASCWSAQVWGCFRLCL